MTMNGSDSGTVTGGSTEETLNPSDLKAKFDAKMKQFAEARNVKPKTEADQEQLRLEFFLK